MLLSPVPKASQLPATVVHTMHISATPYGLAAPDGNVSDVTPCHSEPRHLHSAGCFETKKSIAIEITL